ncbi:MAG: multicopper oxidase domain-containing protein [Microbacteriaceae bacterium]|nr:multicopper oxidase domain-containing protein [Microbacteriaceae bacterium]
MSRRNWYLATNSVVLGWFVLTLVAVGVHRFVDRPLWLLVHVPMLGAVTAAILIWSQHFTDTLTRRAAPAGRVGLGLRLGLQTAGALAITAGMLLDAIVPVLVGAGVLSLAVIAHAVELLVQLRAALPARFAPLVRYYVAAAVVFLGGIALGAMMAASHADGLADRFVGAHLVLNAFGWIGLTALGTLVLLWPTVLHARVDEAADADARRALPILLAGLVIAAAGPVVGVQPVLAIGMVVWLIGAVLIGVAGARQARAMPPGTFAGYSLAAAYGWLVVAAAALAVHALAAPDWATLHERYLAALPPLIVGFAVQIVAGALSYLLPVVAMGSPAAAKAGAEVLDRGAVFRVVALNGSIALYLAPMPSLARVLLSFVAAGVVVAFLILVIRALVVGRRVRRGEGAEPDRSPAVALGTPSTQPPAPPRRRTGAVAAAVLVLALCVAGGVGADPAAVGISTTAQGEVVPSGDTTEVTVKVSGMRFVPAVIPVPYGDRLVVRFENTGTDVHDLTFANGVRTERLAPGGSQTVDVGVVGAGFEGWCSIAGHRQMGMELTVAVVGAPSGAPTASAPTGGPTPGADALSAAEDIDLEKQPSAGFEPWPAALEPAPDTRVHRVTLHVKEIVTEVAPGVRQTRWTFGGTSPGPVLRGTVGDTFEITLVNDGSIGHSIDFHAGSLAPNQPMRTIQPGESLTYTFTADLAGIWMYHCSTMPMSMHIANGMYGAVIVDPPDLAPVDEEYLLVQGELYLGPQGETADADRIATQLPDLVTFNGYANQYVYRPLTAGVGDRVRVWLLDAGPNTPSAFHIVGGRFDTVYREGAYQLRRDDPGGAQVLALEPAQGGFVELAFPEAGDYSFVTHRMSDSEKGARGIVHVG